MGDSEIQPEEAKTIMTLTREAAQAAWQLRAELVEVGEGRDLARREYVPQQDGGALDEIHDILSGAIYDIAEGRATLAWKIRGKIGGPGVDEPKAKVPG